ncbi:hypothetical protein GXM_07707 [Nostoc sphaeroides CCNUC1]|uniref:Uncharacterized protein n=1 Tax=Nostoc sphaeroides CCNUC1 TaxID=2653204 RepID=A0A5P8WBP0_9NOSO|nr:hypothetical protein GXM_07707 [Nostoc sphaeroides CCNUC1]
MVNDKEVFRANTVMRCHRFICIGIPTMNHRWDLTQQLHH